MKSKSQILVFDFDGVICNSIHDSFMTALNTYIQVSPDHDLPLDRSLHPGDVFLFEKSHVDFFNQFSKLMPLANFAEDYFVVIRILEEKKSEEMKNQSRFDMFKRSISREKLSAYQNIFYDTRQRLQEKDPESWASLLPPFPGITESIRSLSGRFVCCIATSKDHQSVDILIRKYGIYDCFRPENILDKDFAESKRDHLMRFHREHDVSYENILFIDDKVSHLIKVKDLGIQAYLALWGFNAEREHEIALEQGFHLLHLEKLNDF